MAIVIANFGGPRSLKEVEPFLISLFTDPDVFRVPAIFRPFFKRLAKKRAVSVRKDYEEIGGKSPIFDDTEYVAEQLRSYFNKEILTFHRYLPATHAAFFKQVTLLDSITCFPMFPQFTYSTTGSIAKCFAQNLPAKVCNKIRWVKSYPTHPAFVQLHQTMIREYLNEHHLEERETILLFSAHGLPQSFIDEGDVYEEECQASFCAVCAGFPNAVHKLCYQSQVGRAQWLTPATADVCKSVQKWREGRRHVLFVPISFTSDHIETLFEIENEYMPLVREAGLNAHRLDSLNRRADWVAAIAQILREETPTNNAMLCR
ncbi:MAG: ferrochelatase [Chlamydiales bacterium]|nr:ferrochelatase [Chlamydiales bacterium]MCP5470409.1 ferrochelatase [Chlamydiales bacterium]